MSQSVHSAEPVTASTSTSSPFDPPPLSHHTSIPFFVSPFHPDQLSTTRAVLKQVHDGLNITPTALIVFMRFQDRLAHYLIERAYYKEESEWSRQRGYNFAVPALLKTCVMPEARSIGDCSSHAILWRFPSHIATGQLGDFLSADRIRVNEKLTPYWKKPLTEEQEPKLKFTNGIAERWLSDFAHGIRNKDQQTGTNQGNSSSSSSSTSNSASFDLISTLPSEMINHEARLGLLAMIEFITYEVFEFAGNCTLDRLHESVTPFDLLHAMINDKDLVHILKFLPIEWDTTDAPQVKQDEEESTPTDSIAILAQSHPGCNTDPVPEIETLLRSEFASELEAYHTKHHVNDAASWYNNDARVREVAKKIVMNDDDDDDDDDDTIDYSPVALSLQKYYTRPYCHWGTRSESLIKGNIAEDLVNEFQPLKYSYTSIIVTDADKIEWHLLLELIWSDYGALLRGFIYALDAFNDPPISSLLKIDGPYANFFSIGRFEPNGRQLEIEINQAWKFLIKNATKASGDAHADTVEKDEESSDDDNNNNNNNNNNNDSDAIMNEASTSAVEEDQGAEKSKEYGKVDEEDDDDDDDEDNGPHWYAPHGLTLKLSSSTSTSESASVSASTSTSTSTSSTFSPLAVIEMDKVKSINFINKDYPGDNDDGDDDENSEKEPESAEQKELECIISHVLHVAENSNQYSSSLYTATQSLKGRRCFTAALIHESFIHANEQGRLTMTSVMPSVLIDIVTDYHSFSLPHLAEEMKVSNLPPSTVGQQAAASAASPADESNESNFASSSERPTKKQKLESISA